MSGRLKNIPLSVYPLLILVLIAAFWLQRSPEKTIDKRAFSVAPETVETLTVLLREGDQGLVMRLDGGPGNWTLEGNVNDLVDQDAVQGFIRSVCAEEISRPLSIRDWRDSAASYGLHRPPVRLMIKHRDGETGLDIGLQNPSTTLFYAAYNASSDLQMVSPHLVEKLTGLLGSVRAEKLWPRFEIDAVDTFTLAQPDQADPDVFVRDNGGRWWLLPPHDGRDRFSELATRYLDLYADRTDPLRGAVRARDPEIKEFVFLLKTSAVKNFRSLGQAPRPLDVAAGLRVHLGSSLDDFSHDVMFAAGPEEDGLLVWRGNCDQGMLISDTAVDYLDHVLDDFLQTRAITETVAWADSLTLFREGRSRIHALRRGKDWHLGGSLTQPEDSPLDDVLEDFIANLENLAVTRVWPADAAHGDRLNPETVTRLELWRHGFGLPAREVIMLGRLTDSDEPVAWFPAQDKLLSVDPTILIFSREYFNMIRNVERD
jgi:uncharacterized protein DUF4340